MKSAFIFLFGVSFAVYGNPQNPSAIAGEIQMSEQGRVLEISTSDRAIINWDSFSIGQGETTRFIQPHSDAAVLNRVLGSEISQIMGVLQSNGQVYLANPQGVVIGKEGRIDTAAFFACAVDVRPEEFLKEGDMLLKGEELGEIIQLGTIETSGGPVVLLAHKITQEGKITAPHSLVSLTAGHEILLQPSGSSLLYIRPDLKAAGVENRGTIEAFEVQIQTDGVGPFAINQGGSIQANAIEERGGRIFLCATDGDIAIQESAHLAAFTGDIEIQAGGSLSSEGTFDVSGEQGGHIHLFGADIEIRKGSFDASGDSSAGEILVGGDLDRKHPNRLYAETTRVAEGVRFNADNRICGDGGTVVLWAEGLTHYHGFISAKSLGASGNGGFVEVSGKKSLSITGHADLRSNQGEVGTLLLDPGQVTISHGADPSPPPPTDTIPDGYINNQLALGTVTIATATDGSSGSQNIIINSAVNIHWSTSSNLILNAGLQIKTAAGGGYSSSIAASGGGGVTFNTALAPTSGARDGISLDALSISTNTGNITLNGVGGDTDPSYGINLFAAMPCSIESADGTITLNGTAGGTSGNIGVYFNSSNLDITTTGSGSIVINGDAATGSTGATGIYMNSTSIAAMGTGSVTLNGSSTVEPLLVGLYSIGDVASINGNINIIGSASGNGNSSAIGVNLFSGATFFASGSGTLNITGTGGNGSSDCCGVNFDGSASVSVHSGNMVVTGTGGTGGGTGNHGVNFLSSCSVQTTGSGSLQFTGTANSSAAGNNGINIDSGTISTAGGNVTFTGSAASTSSYGISLLTSLGAGALIQSTTGAGTASFITTGGSHALFESTVASGSGFDWEGTGGITTDIAGDLTVSSDINPGSYGYPFYIGNSASSGDIQLAADGDINLIGSGLIENKGSGDLILDAGGSLSLSNAPVLQTGGSIQLIGATSIDIQSNVSLFAQSGTITFSSPTTTVSTNTVFTSQGTADSISYPEGPILFSSALSSVGGARNLTFDTGTGYVNFSGNVGTVANPFGVLTFTSADEIFLGGVNLYVASATFNALTTITGNSSITTTGSLQFQDIIQSSGGANSLTLNSGTAAITFLDDVGSSGSPLGALSITSSNVTGTTLDGIDLFATSISFNSNVLLSTASVGIQATAGGLSFGGDVSGSEVLTASASGTLSFADGVQLSLTPGASTTVSLRGGTITLGTGNVIETDGNLFMQANGSMSATGAGTIATTGGALPTVILVVDAQNPSPPSYGTGAFTFPSGMTLSTGGNKVYLYASVPGINTFPTTINGVPYSPGVINTATATYTPGTNELVGYWYNVAPFPPDPPLFEILYKSTGLTLPPPVASTQELRISTTEALLSQPALSPQSVTSSVQGTSTPSGSACHGAPSVSIRVGG